MEELNKNNIREIKDMAIVIADNLQIIRIKLANLRGMGEYMREYPEDSEKIKNMAKDHEEIFKQLFGLLVKTEDIVRNLKTKETP